MKPTYTIATEQDLPEIVRIYNQTIPTRQSTADLEPVTVEERKAWFEAHSANRRPLWLIQLNDQIVGWISLSDFYGRIAYNKTAEVSIYIDEAFRGNHLGFEAVTFVESQVPQLGIETILAFIFGHNTSSLALFKKFGYETWGHLADVAEMDGIKRDLDILGKKYS